MTTETDTKPDRIRRLLTARRRIEDQLDDPGTPGYSIAPLSNQLRLVDKEIERLRRPEKDADEGLPVTPDRATFIDFLRYGRRVRCGFGRREGGNEYVKRYEAIFDSWQQAGFVLPEPTHRKMRGVVPPDEYRQLIGAWVDVCRVELGRCLESQQEGIIHG